MADWVFAACRVADNAYPDNPKRSLRLCMDEDLKLLDRFLANRDEAAFRLLYRQLTPQMFSLAMRMTGGRAEDAEDIVQEAWSRACKLFPRFRRQSRLST